MLPPVMERPSWRALRELSLLSGRRLGATGLARVGRLGAIGLALACLGWVVALRVQDGPTAPTVAIPVKAARAALWLAALPVALAAAHQRSLADRRDGFELAMLARGFTAGALRVARFLAVLERTLFAIVLPVSVAAAASIVTAPSLASARDRLLVLVVVVVHALVVSALLAPLAAACEALAPLRGRTLCVGVLVASWGLADLVSVPALSVFGVLDLSLAGLLSILGLGRIG